ncbi:putative metal-binding motif-containing protein [Olleya sp. R77988]|uniref:putative metal-binding motif-containing protein n=1 Tax=Olleya sp. R77988 TaxID=3093875 RepID=UPI0037CAE17C
MKPILKLSSLFLLIFIVACGNDDDVSCTEQAWYQDADADGFGNPAVTQNACTQPAGYVLVSGDCDDADAATYPGAIDVCGDGIDNNCDGQVDENCVEICDDGVDNDGDGLTDCDDPDCNGDVACPTLYADNDGDGYGDPNNTTNGVVQDNTDCDDNDASINPGATEIPDNNVDEDCDAASSKDYTFYADVDGDGYGDVNNPLVASCPAPCNDESQMTIPAGYVFNSLDCNDSDINVHPYATENTTDGIDNNCNGYVDVVYYYQDVDGDGFGDSNDAGTTVNFAGSSINRTDCDDGDASIFPGASEIQDGIDNNCNGLVDEF